MIPYIKLMLLGAFIVSASFIFWNFTERHPMQNSVEPGTVILLNGTSGAGKSSLQKKLQELFTEPYLALGIDNFFVGVLPDKFKATIADAKPEDIVMKGIRSHDAQNNPVFTLEIGPVGQRVVSGMHTAFGNYAHAGNNIIVDYILYYQQWIPDLVHSLRGLRVYMIGIKPQLSAVEEREKSRGTSPVGHARSHYDTVHTNMIYDLELDTTDMTVEQIALKIKEFVEHNPKPQAFRKLEKQFIK